MGGSSSQPAATLLVGSPHFGVPVAATSEEAQRHALAKISSLLASKEALEKLCNDLFQNVSDDGCGGGVSRSGLRMLTHLVIDGCQVSDPAALHELLDVLAPLPSSGSASEGGDDDAPRLGYDGFVCYARCMLRVVDAALRSEVGAAAGGGLPDAPSAGASATAVTGAVAANGATVTAESAVQLVAEGAPAAAGASVSEAAAQPAMLTAPLAVTPPGLSPVVTPAATPAFPRATPVVTPVATPASTPSMTLLSVPTPTPAAVTPVSTPATLTPTAPTRYFGGASAPTTNGRYASPSVGGMRATRPSSPLPVGRSISPSRAVHELRSTTPPRLGVRPPLRRPNLSLEPLPNTAGGTAGGSTSSSSTARISNGTPPPWASGFLQFCHPSSTAPAGSAFVAPAAAPTAPPQRVHPPSRSAGHMPNGDRGRIPEGRAADAAGSTPFGRSRPPRSLSPRRRTSGPLAAGGVVVGTGASNSVLLARAAPPPTSMLQQMGRSDITRQSLGGSSRGEGGSLASSASLPELTGYPPTERPTRCPPAFPPPSVRGGSLGAAGGWKGPEASNVVSFSFVGSANTAKGLTTPNLAAPAVAPGVATDQVPAPGGAPAQAETAAAFNDAVHRWAGEMATCLEGINGVSCNAGTKGNVMDPLAWGAVVAANGSTESTPPSGLSDVPDVLRQHLDRRKAQLQSMQQRLAKLSHECDSLQGMVKATE
mmetsp:Transcript_165038/g.292193  ORF Transcript_165038/g.292193 Transcript_165038/m.292193 type:complete len:710 (+) Transcript_165038:114-2243(+)